MRTSRRVTVAALLAVASIGLTGVPANAEPSEWGFLEVPVVAQPGEAVPAGVAPVTRWEARFSASGLGDLIRATESCERSALYSLMVIDSRGRGRSAPNPDPRYPLRISASATGGPHWVRAICTQDETTPEFVVVCFRFEIPYVSHPSVFRTFPAVESLASDPCPVQAGGRLLLATVLNVQVALLDRFRDLSAGPTPGGNDAAPGTGSPTTTRPSPSPSPSPSPGGGGDTAAPTVNGVSLTGSTYCQDVSVSASVADAVGVTSASVSWSGVPGSGSMAMSGGGSSWSAVISPAAGFAGPETLTVTVTARDAAGNEGSGSSSIGLGLC